MFLREFSFHFSFCVFGKTLENKFSVIFDKFNKKQQQNIEIFSRYIYAAVRTELTKGFFGGFLIAMH